MAIDRSWMHTTRARSAVVLGALALLVGACSSGDGESSGSDSAAQPDGASDFCAQLESASQEETLDAGDDPEAAAAAAEELRALATEAPEEVAGAITTLADVLDELAQLDQSGEGDMEDFGRVMELMLDPEVIEAGAVLEQYAVAECGFDPEEASERFGSGSDDSGDSGFDAVPGEDPLAPGELDAGGQGDMPGDDIRSNGEISLDDLEALRESHADESWSAKIVSSSTSSISQGASIGMYGKGPDDEYIEREPLTTEESVAACEAVVEAFAAENPGLEVRVGNGDTDLVVGGASADCAPVRGTDDRDA